MNDELRGLIARRQAARERVSALGLRNSAGLSPDDAFAAAVEYEIAQRAYRDLDDEYYRWVKVAATEQIVEQMVGSQP